MIKSTLALLKKTKKARHEGLLGGKSPWASEFKASQRYVEDTQSQKIAGRKKCQLESLYHYILFLRPG